MSVSNYEELNSHVGHRIAVVNYAGANAAVECNTCNTVLLDFDAPAETYPFLIHWIAQDDTGAYVTGETEISLSRAEVEQITDAGDDDYFSERLHEAFETYVGSLKDGETPVGTEMTTEGYEDKILSFLDMADVDDYEPLSAASETIWNRLGYPKLKQPRFRY